MSARAQQKMQALVQKKPLAHPGTLAMRIRDYEYSPPEHLRDLYGKVFRAVSDEYPRSPNHIVEIHPREHGKSEVGTVDTATWCASRDPSARILIMSEGSSLAEDKLSQCRNLLENNAELLGVEIVESNNSSLTLANEANHGEATIEAAGFGSKVTGGHFDVIVFDDLVDWPSQRTESRREKIEKQFQNYLNLGSEGETTYLVLGTRKHSEDLYQQLIDNRTWYTTVKQAISDWSIVENQDYDIITVNPDTGEEFRYQANKRSEIPRDEVIIDTDPYYDVDVLWPERWPLSDLLHDMLTGFGADEGNLVWKRENQNDASALQGQILGEDMLHYITQEQWQDVREGLRWVAGLDPAVEDDPEKAASNDTDYWAFTVLAAKPDKSRIYLPAPPVRKRGITMSQGLSWVKTQLGKWNGCQKVLVEDAQAQRWFVQSGKDEGLKFQRTKSTESKEDRIISMSSMFESGKIVLVEGSDWSSFVQEWASFPTGDHDDRLDSTEIALRGLDKTQNVTSQSMSDLPL